MFRVYKDFLRRMFLITLYYKDMGHDVSSAHEYVRARLDRQDEVTQRALGFLGSNEFSSKGDDIYALLDTTKKLLASDNQLNDRDLVDTIVRLLGLPHAKNVLAGANITRLK